jgi:hypothetical protein
MNAKKVVCLTLALLPALWAVNAVAVTNLLAGTAFGHYQTDVSWKPVITRSMRNRIRIYALRLLILLSELRRIRQHSPLQSL